MLRSRRLAIVLLVALGLFAMLGAILPQQDRIGPSAYGLWAATNPQLAQLSATLNLGALYSAWWFIGLFALLYVNTLACTLPQLRAAFLRSTRQPKLTFNGRKASYELTLEDQSCDPLSAATTMLRRRGYLVASGANTLAAQKGLLALWGSPVFHLGLVVVLTGAAIGGLMGFSGYVEVGEGQGFVERGPSYQQSSAGPLFDRGLSIGPVDLSGKGHRGFSLQLDKFSTRTSNWLGGVPSEITSEFTIYEGETVARQGVVSVNQSFEYRGMQIYPAGVFGPAPVFDLELPDGSHESGLVYLGRGAQGGYENTLYLPGTIYRLTLRAQEGDNALEATVSERQQSLFNGRLEPGQPTKIADVTLTLKELRHWTGFRVVSDPGTAVLFVGFGLVVLGLTFSFIAERREIWVEVVERAEGGVLRLGGHAPRLKATFAMELEELAESLVAAQASMLENAKQSQLAGPSGGREAWISSAAR